MRVLMLGWEFPPFIAGGLGVACYGLTKALDRLGHEIVFILPRPVERSHSSHVRLLSPEDHFGAASAGAAVLTRGDRAPAAGGTGGHDGGPMPAPDEAGADSPADFPRTEFRGVEASFSHAYPGFDDAISRGAGDSALGELGLLGGDAPHQGSGGARRDIARGGPLFDAGPGLRPRAAGPAYAGDLVGDAERYARLVVAMARRERFDIIHAHDWLTFPAGQALARVSRKPLIVQVHSTEFDRSGEHVHQAVYDIERRGMHAAQRIIAVSMYTKSLITSRYGVRGEKVDIVYNGVEGDRRQPGPESAIGSGDRIVLFLGRITMQKGPEYFIAAARRVLEKVENVKFVVAGSGDMATRMIDLAAELGIGHKVLFTGFLRGRDVERVFRMADCYVMPSVSEPFGISALEALQHDVPIIISKQSGVSEVLTHALKVDFWDTDEMANKIIAVLRHQPLSATLRQQGAFEVRRLTWEGAAEKCLETYHRAIEGAGHQASARLRV